MKEKNKVVIANIAIRALCCFGALSFGYCFPDNRVGPQNGIIERQKQRDLWRNKHIPGTCTTWWEYSVAVNTKQWVNYELHSLIKLGKQPLI